MKTIRWLAGAGLVAILTWCAIGSVIYPEWWYRLVWEANYKEPSYWAEGNYAALWNTVTYFLPIALTVFAILALSRTPLPERIELWNRRFASWLASPKGVLATSCILLAIFAVGIGTSGVRSADSRQAMDRLAKSQKDLQAMLDKQKAVSDEAPPLSDPTSFAYIDPQEVESLYGQNEPDLVPALVRERIETSSHLTAGFSIDEYLKTDAGVERAKHEETELRETEKNPQRKLRDLIRFLYDENKLKRYGHQRWKSADLQKLEDATALLSKYGVVADAKKLRSVRDRLLSEEVQRLDDELSVLHGLVLVEADWTVETTSDSYIFRAPVVEHISKPLYFETRIRNAGLTAKTRDVIETLKTRPIRLSVFGNVISGASPDDRSVHIAPIAAF